MEDTGPKGEKGKKREMEQGNIVKKGTDGAQEGKVGGRGGGKERARGINKKRRGKRRRVVTRAK